MLTLRSFSKAADVEPSPVDRAEEALGKEPSKLSFVDVSENFFQKISPDKRGK